MDILTQFSASILHVRSIAVTRMIANVQNLKGDQIFLINIILIKPMDACSLIIPHYYVNSCIIACPTTAAVTMLMRPLSTCKYIIYVHVHIIGGLAQVYSCVSLCHVSQSVGLLTTVTR